MRGMLSLCAAATVLACAVPLLAHHSGAAEFDNTKKIDLTGTVTKMEWVNPHAHFLYRREGQGRQGGQLESGVGQSQHPDPQRLAQGFG